MKFKLVYLDGRGVAETTRYLFHSRSKQFEDERLNYDDFKAKQANGELGLENLHRLPLLVVTDADGVTYRIGQSAAIERFVGTCLQLRGDNPRENAFVDTFCEHLVEINSVFRHLVPYHIRKSQEIQEQLQLWFESPVPSHSNISRRYLQFYLDKLESLVSPEGTVLAGGKLSMADAKLYALLVDNAFDDAIATRRALQAYPKLTRIIEDFANVPGIKSWITERPLTPF